MTLALTPLDKIWHRFFWDAINNFSQWYPGKEANLLHASSLLSAEWRRCNALEIISSSCVYDSATCYLDDWEPWHFLHRQIQLNPLSCRETLASIPSAYMPLISLVGFLGHPWISQSYVLSNPKVWLSGSNSDWEHLSASAFGFLQKSNLTHQQTEAFLEY